MKTRLFGFPSEVKSCEAWLKAIGDPALAKCLWDKLTRFRWVCKEHFFQNEILPSRWTANNAVPSIFTEPRTPLPQEALEAFEASVPPDRIRSPTSHEEGVSVLDVATAVGYLPGQDMAVQAAESPCFDLHGHEIVTLAATPAEAAWSPCNDLAAVPASPAVCDLPEQDMAACIARSPCFDPLSEEIMAGVANDPVTARARPEYMGTSHDAGYVGKRMLGVLKGRLCQECKDSICADKVEDYHLYIQSQEFDPSNPALIYPSKGLTSAIRTVVNVFELQIVRNQQLHSKTLKQAVLNLLTTDLTYSGLGFDIHGREVVRV